VGNSRAPYHPPFSHPRAHPYRRIAVALVLLFGGLASEAADDSTAKELEQLREEIQVLEQQLASKQGERSEARAALRPIELRISRLGRALRATRKQREHASRELEQTRRQQARQRETLAAERDALAREIRAAYVLGNQPYLKLLLNQEDPARSARALAYYRYYAAARNEHIGRLERRLQVLARLEQDVGYKRAKLDTVEQRLARESSGLENVRRQRRQLVAALDRDVRSRQRDIDQRHKAERELDRLLDRIDVAAPRQFPSSTDHRAFARHRGRLPLPTGGRLAGRFGTRRGHGDLKWKGVFLETGEAQEVRAIFPGRVVFADWLDGYGMLLIIDHGDGYMTLYGNNESLFAKEGEQVEGGQVVSSTGSTGNPFRPGLYFEIRHQGNPQDPLRWCRRA
jgi:septal ring factor EnvC (AmiA/AmiB activator)